MPPPQLQPQQAALPPDRLHGSLPRTRYAHDTTPVHVPLAPAIFQMRQHARRAPPLCLSPFSSSVVNDCQPLNKKLAERRRSGGGGCEELDSLHVCTGLCAGQAGFNA